jgi:primase-polymerase (primpol)-like protein
LPKYAQIPPSLLEGNQWCSWARSPFQWAKGGAR